ncbi:hypothetical protein O7627_36730 [Solwaraspora sp. WMMD1047]|uniref:hypothetical protein n=1 Tax=Solwaraspora sp. WMMD1047 TaxID=3016102 RepID=UPI0024168B26|nr:hypothetical protein [Solwaraspora sp. WMMD1047]MDG4834816.1 hypothetical protein [Solwaraspora sp. WMMD1047]
MDERLLADLRCGDADGVVKTGSGYRISRSLVLTAAHNLRDRHGVLLPRVEIWLGHPMHGVVGPFGAVEVWVDPAGADVALVRVSGDLPPMSGVVRWGRSTGVQQFGYTGAGYPAFAEFESGQRAVTQLSGVVNPLSMGPGGGFAVEQDAFPDTRADVGRGHPWAGLSGAAVFCDPRSQDPPGGGQLLVGVCVRDSAVFAGRRLYAHPVAALCREPGFVAQMVADGAAVPWVESVQLHGALSVVMAALVGTPGSLLAADGEVVAFHGRRDALNVLAGWRDQPGAVSVTVVSGAGGQGRPGWRASSCVRPLPASWAGSCPARPGRTPTMPITSTAGTSTGCGRVQRRWSWWPTTPRPAPTGWPASSRTWCHSRRDIRCGCCC